MKVVPFVKDDDILEPISNSQSGATVLKVIRGDKNFFLKIMDGDLSFLTKIKKIIWIYAQYTSKPMLLLDSGIVSNQVYCIYSWIEGSALNHLYDEYSNEQFYTYGVRIGKYFNRINQNIPKEEQFEKKYDLSLLTHTSIANFMEFFTKNEKAISSIFSRDEINHIIDRILVLQNSFMETEKVYIHGDLHPKNVMINREEELTIIDCESFCIDYFVMNFRWNLASIFKTRSVAYFYSGLIKGFYKENPPTSLYNQLLYILLLKFLEQTYSYTKIKPLDFILQYMEQYKVALDCVSIEKDNHNFLDDETVFEKCQKMQYKKV